MHMDTNFKLCGNSAMRGWWIVGIWAGFCAALLCLVWTAAFGASVDPMWEWFSKNKDAAGWVQAFGSIAAILATAAVVWWQETRRREDIRVERLQRRTDQLESLVAMATTLVDLLYAVRNTYDYFSSEHSSVAFEDIARALGEVPVHEARSHSVAKAEMTLRRISGSVLKSLEWLEHYHLRTLYSPALDIEADEILAKIFLSAREAKKALRALEVRLATVDQKLPWRLRGMIKTPWQAPCAD